jgi:hypothetical protein
MRDVPTAALENKFPLLEYGRNSFSKAARKLSGHIPSYALHHLLNTLFRK